MEAEVCPAQTEPEESSGEVRVFFHFWFNIHSRYVQMFAGSSQTGPLYLHLISSVCTGSLSLQSRRVVDTRAVPNTSLLTSKYSKHDEGTWN